MRIDLNADVGESFGPYTMGADDALLPFVTSVNVACGFHAGDPSVIDRTVARAVASRVAVGAHPGYWDLRGFGRRPLPVEPAEVEADVLYQIGALAAFARAHGSALVHVKPHGALYNQAAVDEPLARAIARAVARVDAGLRFVGAATSDVMRHAAADAGLAFAAEAFVDRAYEADGSLRSRKLPGAVITDPEAAAAQALGLACDQRVRSHDGATVRVQADTLCLHGDNPRATDVARAVRTALESAGVSVQALGR
jgi:UPF0271 protein